jgi:KaiC/GvpD/RAD55 family RecA-like ATPase
LNQGWWYTSRKQNPSNPPNYRNQFEVKKMSYEIPELNTSLRLPGKFKPQSVAEILAEEPTKVEWLWQDYIAEGDLGMIVAYMKVGKSFFFYSLALAIARGELFLGRATKKSPVLILSLEEHPRDVEKRIRKLGMKDEPIHIHRGSIPSYELPEIRDYVKKHGIKIIFIDSLSYWWDIYNEIDNAEITKKLKPLVEFAHEDNVAVYLIHHTSKWGGRNDITGESKGDGRSIRGGGAIFANVDQVIEIDRPLGGTQGRRILRTIGRRAESPRELLIEAVGNFELSVEEEGYEWRVIGHPTDVELDTRKEKLLSYLNSEPKSIKILEVESEIPSKALRQSLGSLCKEGRVLREGKGTRNDPHTYRLK